MNRKREEKKEKEKVAFNQVQNKRNFQNEKKKKDEIAGRIVNIVQCLEKGRNITEQICQSRTSSNVKT